jgi:sterol desaturase/sphingolipid hydroxylase (fatty acid hydroxylase superfamily)
VPVRNYIAFAIPFFLLFIGLEILVARAQRRRVHRLQDALADLGCGIGQQIVMVFAGAAVVAGYGALYDRFRVVTFAEGSFIPWLVSFLVVDLAYYWWHRLSHEVNFLWAAHAVHHQSEDYNLAVALRQSILTSFTSLPFHYPMALLGVPPVVYATMVAASTLYQFWIHTELVGKLGWLELFLNTPSHHRVHHAVNPQYLDRNYGATLIVWDRLFGTFVEEREPAVFGTTKPIRSFDPAWAQVQAWFEIAEKARPLRRFRDRVRIWLAPPSYDPLGRPGPGEAELRSRRKHAVGVPGALKAYALAQVAALVAATFLMLLWQYSAPKGPLLAAAAFVFWTLGGVGALLDGKRRGVAVELARLAALAAVVVAWRPGGLSTELTAGLALGGAAGLAAWVVLAARSMVPAAAAQRERLGATGS